MLSNTNVSVGGGTSLGVVSCARAGQEGRTGEQEWLEGVIRLLLLMVEEGVGDFVGFALLCPKVPFEGGRRVLI